MLFTGASLTLLVVYLLRPLSQLRHPWRVGSVRLAAKRTWEVRIEPVEHSGLDYRAGQFLWLNIGNSPFTLVENPFSIASAPAEGPELRFVIKELGDTTSAIGRVPEGTPAYIDGPHGTLTIDGHDEPGIALIASGVGIAPMLSILRQLRATGDKRPTLLIYGNRTASQIVAADELQTFANELGTEVIHYLAEDPMTEDARRGRLNRADILQLFSMPGRQRWLCLVCGPPPMLDMVEDALMAAGVPAHNTLSERSTYD